MGNTLNRTHSIQPCPPYNRVELWWVRLPPLTLQAMFALIQLMDNFHHLNLLLCYLNTNKGVSNEETYATIVINLQHT